MDLKEWLKIIKQNKRKLLVSLFFLIVASTIYGLSGDYIADHIANTAVSPDLILDHIGPYNLSFIFIWLFLVVIAVGLLYPLIFKPKELPYVLNMFSFFLIVRSGFVIFTHLRPPVDAVVVHFPLFLNLLNFTNDLFFSGHAGIPFLGFLMFRRHNRLISYFMLISSFVLGVVVLLMHVHYSIDVFSAYFITYGIYVIGNKFVKN